MREIPLTQGAVALVDDEDFDRINQHPWALNPDGTGYALRTIRRNGKKTTIQMHREILGATDGDIIDHINGNGLDNRKSNLRIATMQKNAFNRKKLSGKHASRYKGIFLNHEKSWRARITYNNSSINLGSFNNEALAAAAYNYGAAIFFGEYRRENVGQDIPVLSEPLKEQIFQRCQRACEKHGWYVNTERIVRGSTGTPRKKGGNAKWLPVGVNLVRLP